MATALVVALRARGADVKTVIDAGLRGKDDKAQLEWAASNKRTLYTFNVSDFCRLHREYLDRGTEHAGIIVVPRQRYDVKQQIRLLLDLLKTKSAEDLHNILYFM
ncbi:MAG TPA: DUF5615 family PIN-like protein [Terriglobia bacterium]|nr:DUF5615 family PIN-like protein [Terriglobia bacterium]